MQSLSDELAATGTPSGTWTDVASLRASVETLSGKEGYEANQNTARLTHLVEIRWRSGVASEMRVVWVESRSNRERILQIHSVLEDPKRTRMTLQCEERIE